MSTLNEDAATLEALADRLDNHDAACPGWTAEAAVLKDMAARMKALDELLGKALGDYGERGEVPTYYQIIDTLSPPPHTVHWTFFQAMTKNQALLKLEEFMLVNRLSSTAQLALRKVP